jgi:hypothetical protein
MMSIRSVHSRRTVPTQRSANEFARGACGGVLSTSMSSDADAVRASVSNARDDHAGAGQFARGTDSAEATVRCDRDVATSAR